MVFSVKPHTKIVICIKDCIQAWSSHDLSAKTKWCQAIFGQTFSHLKLTHHKTNNGSMFCVYWAAEWHIFPITHSQYVQMKLNTVDPVTNDLASARQKKSLVTESRWSQE